MGTTNPAPTDIVTSFIFNAKSVGAPFTAGSPVNDREVLAMHTGRFP